MKKIISLVAASTLVLCMGVSAFAAGSATTVVSTPAATDSTGATVAVVEVAVANATADAPKLAAVNTGAAKADATVDVLYFKDVSVPAGVTVSESSPITLSFEVPAPASGVTYVVLHLKNGVWENLGGTYANGKVSASFTSLSPVAVVSVQAKATTSSSSSSSDDASPKTGESSAVVMVMGVLFLAGCGAAVVSRKERQF